MAGKYELASRFKADIAVDICERIAGGALLKDIAGTGNIPGRSTVYRWLTLYPDFKRAFDAARTLSGLMLEEEALSMARILKGENDFTGTKVQAYNIAMQQFRWSAARRDPDRYGQKADSMPQTNIQINTNLPLDKANIGASGDSIYEIHTKMATAAGLPEPPLEGEIEGEVEDALTIPDDARKLHIGTKVKSARKPPRKKGHKKSLNAVRVTASRYRARKDNTKTKETPDAAD